MNLLVGGTGFIGGHVVEYLFQQGEISKGTFRKGSHLKVMDANGVQGMEADLLDHHSLHAAVEGVDTIYNLASPMPDSDKDFLRINTEGLLNLLEVATEAGVKSFVHLSTLDVFGFGISEINESSPLRPSNDYQKSKAEAERILQAFSRRSGLPRVVSIRPARAIGPRDETLTIPLLRMVENGRVVLPQTKLMSFSHPKDIAQSLYKAATGQAQSGSTYLVKSFDAPIDEVARALTSSMGKSVEVRRLGLLAKSSLPRYSSEQVKAALKIETQPRWKELGYEPAFTLKSTCDDIASWYSKEPWVTESA